jgi:hypothetical protein
MDFVDTFSQPCFRGQSCSKGNLGDMLQDPESFLAVVVRPRAYHRVDLYKTTLQRHSSLPFQILISALERRLQKKISTNQMALSYTLQCLEPKIYLRKGRKCLYSETQCFDRYLIQKIPSFM